MLLDISHLMLWLTILKLKILEIKEKQLITVMRTPIKATLRKKNNQNKKLKVCIGEQNH